MIARDRKKTGMFAEAEALAFVQIGERGLERLELEFAQPFESARRSIRRVERVTGRKPFGTPVLPCLVGTRSERPVPFDPGWL